jgi:oxygen-independent coproporphyrinogen-3 oxidase
MTDQLPQAWLPFASKSLPRYTSYPTAIAFKPAADEVPWLDEGSDAPLSLYVHVPFCERLCWYCGCNTTIVSSYERIAAFHQVLLKEIDLWRPRAASWKGLVRHLHFGGGSPNALKPEDFTAVVRALQDVFTFAPDAEIAVELDPALLNPAFIDGLGEAGVTRASLGVQTFDAEVQALVNRPQPFDLVADAVSRLRRAGVKGVNFDLMYGLPAQTPDNVAATARMAASLEPDRLAVFGYAHVPWMKKHQKLIEEGRLADVAGRWAQAGAADALLVGKGYRRIGLDHYAQPDDPLSLALDERRLRRNFQGYTDDPASVLAPFGPSAIGHWSSAMVQNAVDARAWRDAVGDGRFPVVRLLCVTDEDRLRGEVIERLMTYLDVDLEAVCLRHGVEAGRLDSCLETLRPLEEAGLCETTGRRVRIPESARRLARVAAAAFDAHLVGAGGRHARAI